MYKNYEKRVKDFVIDMTNPETMIEHKDITEKITNTRTELINEQFANNPEKNRPLVFRGYTSEADRIKDVIKNHKYLYYLPDYEKIKQERKKLRHISYDKNGKKIYDIDGADMIERNNINKLLNEKYGLINPDSINKNIINTKTTISQPTMRYKPRTDLERVYDALNGYNYDQASRDIIERQLKSINLYDFKKNITLNEPGKGEGRPIFKRQRFLSKSLQRKGKKRKNVNSLYKMNNVYYNPNKSIYKPWQRREDLNTEAYGFLSSYHYKTHFKAAEEIAESNYRANKGNNNPNSVFLLPNLLPKYYKPRVKTENNLDEKEDPFKFGEDYSSSEYSEDYDDFEKNYNPIIHKDKAMSDPKTMEILTKIAFRQKKGLGQTDFKNEHEDQKIVRKIKKPGNKNYTEDNNVIINNKLYYKNTQFDQITHKVLEMCNIYSPKSKFNNIVHKSKGGKTMITKGMTVGEFEKKFNIQE